MNYKLADLVDLKKLDELLKKFTNATGTATALLDTDGNVLCAAGWSDICTRFHRVNPDTLCRCTESDTALAGKLKKGEKYNVYRCLNGLVDVATPIFIEGAHVGNIFIGQFLFEEPDVEFFRKQASLYGFNEAEYLDALKKVPIFSEERVEQTMGFLDGLTEMIGEMGLTQKRQLKLYEEQRKSKEALRESEDRFRAAFESAQDCILIWDKDYNYLYANQAAIDHVGTTRDKVIGKNIRDGLGHVPEFMRLWMSRIDQVFKTKEVLRVQDETMMQGQRYFTDSVLTPIFHSDGRVSAVCVLYRDLSEQVQANVALRESEKLLIEAQAMSHIGHWEYDLTTKELNWSDEIYRIFGLEPQQEKMTFEMFLNIIHPKDRAFVEKAYAESIENHTIYDVNHRLLLKDGTIKYVNERCETFYDDAGKGIRSIGTIQDITERKLAEEERREYVQFLESLEKINRIIGQSTNLEEIMNNVLDAVLTIFDCDRAWLLYPCDPEAPAWQVPMEKTKPEYPGAGEGKKEYAMTPDAAEDFRKLLATSEPIIGELKPEELGWDPEDKFSVRSMMSIAIHPRTGNAWDFGLHQCSHTRIWTETERRLFKEISQRIGDALNSLLIFRDLSASEERYRVLADNATDIIWTMNLEQRFTYISPSVEKMRGYTPEEALQIPLENTLTSQSMEKITRIMMEELARENEPGVDPGRNITLELEHIRKDGSTFWAEVTSTFLRDASGAIEGILGITRDISDRKQAEEQLQRSEALLSAAISQSPSGIVIADAPNVRIRYANTAAFRIRGEAQELLTEIDVENHSRNWRIYNTDGITPYPPEQLPLSRAIIEGVVSKNVDLIMENDSGEKRWVSTNASPIRDKDGRITSGIVVFHDVTESKRAEEERAKLEDQLRQSQKMEAIGRLAGGVAHDFNNILTGINGYSEMIIAGLEAGDPLRLDMEEILKAGERASALTAQLLAFSRKQVIAPKVIQPNEILERSQKMLRRIIGEDVDLMFAPAHNLGHIMADPAQLDQILVNLAVNARDAMPGGGKLTIETQNITLGNEKIIIDGEAIQMSGNYVLLAVSDNGHGMDEETCRKIFEPFFSTKEMGKGTGLGLATVYGIVRQNEGFITVYSEPGSGTVFKLYFPRVDEKAQHFKNELLNKSPGGNETILLVEDEDMVRALARKILERHGYKVIDAADAEKAIGKMEEEAGEVHLILTDVILPNMNGRQLFEILQTTRPGLRALFMSGYTENVIAHHGVLEEGMIFLQKPFTIEVLTRKVREALDK